MNNETISNLSSQVISDTKISIVQLYTYFSCITLLVYASFLHFSDEVEYIWERKFTLLTYLYVLSKYPVFVFFSMVIVDDLLPNTISALSLCNKLGILAQIMSTLAYIGVQGLIALRTYTLCQGYRPIAIIFFIAFLTPLAIELQELVVIPPCNGVLSGPNFILSTLHNATIIFLDIFAFAVLMYQSWGLIRLKRSLGLQSNEDVVTLLFKQGVLRLSLILLLTTSQILLSFFAEITQNFLTPFQNVFSTILICEFTLDLRRHNSKISVPNQSALDLPALSFRDNPVRSTRFVLVRLHESIMAEMRETNDSIDTDGPNSRGPDEL